MSSDRILTVKVLAREIGQDAEVVRRRLDAKTVNARVWEVPALRKLAAQWAQVQ